jgi:hypothetical protein
MRNVRTHSSVLLISIWNDINVIKKIKKIASISSRMMDTRRILEKTLAFL